MASASASRSALPECSWCKATSSKLLKCGRCKLRAYCSQDCQRRDWREGGHKQACVKMCSRCTKPFTEERGACRVPHPVHTRKDMGSQFGASGSRNDFACDA